jgi:hypothetical protein
MAFLHAWLSARHSIKDMNNGLPPNSWVEEIKTGVADIYHDMNGKFSVMN